MKRWWIFISLVLCVAINAESREIQQSNAVKAPAPFTAAIVHTAHVEAIASAVASAPPDSLIVFDVWSTLIDPKDAVFHISHRPWMLRWLAKNYPEVDEARWRHLMGFIDRDVEIALVNPKLSKIFELAKTKGKTVVLTKFWCGQTAAGISFEEQRLAALRKVGIILDDPFAMAAGWQNVEQQASYSLGLIQTEAALKGPVLKAFLQAVGWQPAALIFVDDRLEQCESIAQTAKELGFPALCLHYTEAIERQPTLDPLIADIQLRTLLNEERWISEAQARLVAAEVS